MDEVYAHYNTKREHLETGEIPQERWEEGLKAGKSLIRPIPPGVRLDLILSLHYPRTVKKDGLFSFQGRLYKLKHLAGERITVALIPNEKLYVLKNNQKVAEFPI